MTSQIRDRIASILKDKSRSKEERISELLNMREDVRALQRVETEAGGMTTEQQGSSGLREIDRALEKLGHDELAQADENNPATL